jgi:D-amino-acid dehydrogenase
MRNPPLSDVVVIGGGIVGSSVAYHAARAGLAVTLVDRADEGHATAAGAGIIAPGVGADETDPHNALVAQAGAYYPTLLAHLASDGEEQTGYDRVGAIMIATNETEADYLAEAKRFADASLAAGVQGINEVSLLDGDQARTLFPALAAVPAALHLAGTARIDGRLMREALQRAAQRHGATIRRGEAALMRDAHGSAQVFLDGQPLPSQSVVIAAGAWSASLGEALGIAIAVYPQRGQIAHLVMPETNTSQWPVVLTFQGHYLLTFSPDRVVAGATRENDSGFDYRLTAGGVHQVLGQALRVAPGLARGTLREVRIGFRPATADGLPILGRAPGLENVYIATGHGPTGLTMGPHAGALIVDLIRGEPIAIDLAPYAAERFQAVMR